MAQAELTSTAQLAIPRSSFHWVFSMFLKPKTTFERILAQENAAWPIPLMILTVSAVLYVVVSGHASYVSGRSEEPTLPPNLEYYAPESQDQLRRAMEVADGPIFHYLFPAAMAIARVWLGWLIVSAGLHFLLTLKGGRGSNRSAMNLTAWAGLPFALRDIVRIVYVLITGQAIQYPGLSGLAPVTYTSVITSGYTEILRLIDVYWVWHVTLLVVAIRAYRDIRLRKGISVVMIMQLFALLIQVVPGLFSQRLADLAIIQPFFF